MLLALACFVVLALVLKALKLHQWVAIIVSAALTIVLGPYLALIPIGSFTVWWVGIGVALVLLPWWLGPLFIHATQRSSAASRFDPFDPALHRVPESVTTTVRETTASLTAAGFELVADLFQTGFMPLTSARLVLFEKRSTGQQAMCVGMLVNTDPVRIVAHHVELSTSFADGRAFLVNNSDVLNAFSRVAGKTVEQLPTVRDPARLAAIHEKLLDRARGESSPVQRDRSIDPAAYLAALLLREMESQIPPGNLRFEQATNAYRPTVKGAATMCWKLLPPWSTVRRARMRRREAELLAELGTTGGDAQPLTAAPSVMVTRGLSWAGAAVVGMIAAYAAAIHTSPAGALEPAVAPALVPAEFEVPNEFPGAVRALEQLAHAPSGPLMVRDTFGVRIRTSGAALHVSTQLADSLIASAQHRFLARGFFLFRHEPNYGLDGRLDELALVPVWDQYRVVKIVGTSAPGAHISNADVIDWLRALAQDEPFVLTGIGDDHIEARFVGRLADPPAMARRLYAFCPDIVDQGAGSTGELATELRRLNSFSCWWD